MATRTIPGLEEAIEAAWATRHRKHAPAVRLVIDEAVNEATYRFVGFGLGPNQSCDDAECPNRPAWDVELDIANGRFATALGKDVERLIRRRLAAFAQSFQAEHPEAVLRPAEEAAA